MPDESQGWTPEEDVETLAGFMGWSLSDDRKTWFDTSKATRGYVTPACEAIRRPLRTQSGQRWNPFISASADLQVLERVREVWPHKSFTRNERCVFFESLPHNGFSDQYSVGDWSRAALAVLREMDGQTNG